VDHCTWMGLEVVRCPGTTCLCAAGLHVVDVLAPLLPHSPLHHGLDCMQSTQESMLVRVAELGVWQFASQSSKMYAAMTASQAEQARKDLHNRRAARFSATSASAASASACVAFF